MRSAGLRNKPIDRRYLSDQDKGDYNNSGEHSNRARALAYARGRRGQIAYQASRPMNTTSRTPGTGGFTAGIGAQQNRLREYGRNRKSEFQIKAPSSKGDMYGPRKA